MLTYEQVREWVRGRYGPLHAERRITDIGYAYLVTTQPDAYLDGDASAMTYGNGPDLVVKRTGAVWQFGSSPMLMPLYDVRSEDDLRRAMAALLPGWDPDRPHGSIPLTQAQPGFPPVAPAYPASPPAPPAYPAAAPAYPMSPAAVPAYPMNPLAPPAYPAVPQGPEFVAADADNAVLVDAVGVSFDQRDVVTDFAWQDIHAVHHTVRGLCLLVGVTHRNGVFHEGRVGAGRQKKLREWSQQLAVTLGHYRGGNPGM
ncbi:hypothetical protein [Streptomyces sp. V1I6]|uniref:hypothetical protein n=1 Tax=Streptomyces sp. V1I6 TaxID=3042273 RepID=UPI0027862F8C|nr:hypothetical protein [Streptomyces sp. V1I6]MDQ0844770.1 hypothetical protein [Streptomyces sp. V1I6]